MSEAFENSAQTELRSGTAQEVTLTPARMNLDAQIQDRWLLVVCLLAFTAYIAQDLATLTMGLDGVVYAAIAKFIAAGEGSFWFPPGLTIGDTAFHEHPPLGLWLQGQWFRLFGDSFWVENGYLLLLTLINAGLVMRLWCDLTDRTDAWWPLLILFLIPVTSFTIRYNALENLVSICALAAVLCAWHARYHLWLNLLVGVLSAIGFLIKGPVALFPLAAPSILAVVIDQNWLRACKSTGLCLTGFAAVSAVVVTDRQAMQSLGLYIDRQVLASLFGERPIMNGRGYQLYHLSISLAVCAMCTALAWLSARSIEMNRRFWAVLLIACSASIPLLISPRHFKHYLLPCLPFFAMAAAMLVHVRFPRVPRPVLVLVCTVLILISASRFVLNFGAPGKDVADLATVARIAAMQHATVVFCNPQPALQAYLARHYGLKSAVAMSGQSTVTPRCID